MGGTAKWRKSQKEKAESSQSQKEKYIKIHNTGSGNKPFDEANVIGKRKNEPI